MNIENIEEGLKSLGPSIVADGGDIQLEKIENQNILVNLVFSENACMDCILPKNILEEVVKNHLKKFEGNIEKVVLNDPREEKSSH